jgi:hypothetical protein
MNKPIPDEITSTSQREKRIVLFVVILLVIIVLLMIYSKRKTSQSPISSKTDSTKVFQIIKDTNHVIVNIKSKLDSIQTKPKQIKLNSEFAKLRGTFIDSRDSQTYKWVKIGKQIWMAENLAYKTDKGCWAYDNNLSNVEIYGYLYEWEIAKKVCPAGWHLPKKRNLHL